MQHGLEASVNIEKVAFQAIIILNKQLKLVLDELLKNYWLVNTITINNKVTK